MQGLRKILCLLGLVLGSNLAFGQTSAITATISDTDGTAWSSGPYTIQLVNSSGQPIAAGGAYRIDTGATITNSFSGTLDGSGALSVTLTTTSNINPAGTKWKFGICPNTIPAVCGGTSLTITASGSLSSQLSASILPPRIGGGPGTQAYADVEVAATPNNSYLNVGSLAGLRCYGSSWAACGGGGSSLPTATAAGQVPTATGAGTTYTAQTPSTVSQKVIYTSKISGVTGGVAVIPGSSATSTTDSATAINAAIASGNVDLEVDSGYALSTSLVLSSNTTIHCIAPQYGFIMQTSANAPVVINAHQNAPTTASGTGGFLVSNLTDQNIVVNGCQLNANSLQAVTGNGLTPGTVAHTTNPGTGLMVPATLFTAVNGLDVEHNEIYDGGVYGIAFSNVQNFLMNWNFIHNPLPIVQEKFTDGIHCVGPCIYGKIIGNLINSGDDTIALNADDVNRTGSGSGNQAASSLTGWKWGPIQHVQVGQNTFQAADYGIRLNSGSELIDDIQITDTQGTLCGNTFVFGQQAPGGTGNIGTVHVSGWNVSTTGTCNNFSQPYNFELAAVYKALTIDGLQYSNPAVNWPILTQTQAGGVLSIRNWDIVTTSSTFSGLIVTTASPTSIVASGINWNDTQGTTKVFSGGSVPATLTCSNYQGPNRLLNYTPTNILGDCFAGLTFLSSQTTSGSQSTVTFSSIPQGYRSLHLVAQYKLSSSSGGNLEVNFNGDATTAHYAWQLLFGASTTASALSSGSTTAAVIGPGLGGDTCDIYGYSSAAQGVNVACSFGQFIIGANANAGTAAGYWNQTSPVTSFVLSDFASGHFVDGSTFTLYGYQ